MQLSDYRSTWSLDTSVVLLGKWVKSSRIRPKGFYHPSAYHYHLYYLKWSSSQIHRSTYQLHSTISLSKTTQHKQYPSTSDLTGEPEWIPGLARGLRSIIHLICNIDMTRMLLGAHSIRTGGEGTIRNIPSSE